MGADNSMRKSICILVTLLCLATFCVAGCRSDISQRRAKLTEDAMAIAADFATAKDIAAEAAAVNRLRAWYDENRKIDHVGYGFEIMDARNKQISVNETMAMQSLPADGVFLKLKLSWSADKEHDTEQLAVFKHRLISKENLGNLLLE